MEAVIQDSHAVTRRNVTDAEILELKQFIDETVEKYDYDQRVYSKISHFVAKHLDGMMPKYTDTIMEHNLTCEPKLCMTTDTLRTAYMLANGTYPSYDGTNGNEGENIERGIDYLKNALVGIERYPKENPLDGMDETYLEQAREMLAEAKTYLSNMDAFIKFYIG